MFSTRPSRTHWPRRNEMDIGLIAAFIGGILALLSPCGALLLPAFFASSVGGGLRLAAHGLIFFTGLLVVLVPLGLGAGAVGTLFVSYRGLIVLIDRKSTRLNSS